jgi:hypothetical protein
MAIPRRFHRYLSEEASLEDLLERTRPPCSEAMAYALSACQAHDLALELAAMGLKLATKYRDALSLAEYDAARKCFGGMMLHGLDRLDRWEDFNRAWEDFRGDLPGWNWKAEKVRRKLERKMAGRKLGNMYHKALPRATTEPLLRDVRELFFRHLRELKELAQRAEAERWRLRAILRERATPPLPEAGEEGPKEILPIVGVKTVEDEEGRLFDIERRMGIKQGDGKIEINVGATIKPHEEKTAPGQLVPFKKTPNPQDGP